MKSFDKRIDKLGDHLSPTEIVLRWLQETLKFGSMNDLGEALATKPDSAWPLFRLPKEAERAAKASMPDMPKDKIDARAREYVRDVVFLWRLHLEVNCRIDDQLRPAAGSTAFLLSKLGSQLPERAGLSDARGACRDLPYPLDAETADEYISDAALASTVRRVERRLKALVRSKVIRSAKRVSLPALPHAFLSAAPLLDGRWIDVSVLELAELGVILADGGFRRQESEDPHTLAGEEFVQLNQRGEASPINDESWLEARRIAAVRVRGYRGRRRVIDGRDYVELVLYQRWRKRSLGSRLETQTESGFVLSAWNAWVNGHGPNAALAGAPVKPLGPWVDANSWTLHDDGSARERQSPRENAVAALRPPDIGQTASAADGEAHDDAMAWLGRALRLLTLLDGLANSVERIRAAYFRNSEIVYTDFLQDLAGCQSGIRELLEMFDAHKDWCERWLPSSGFGILPGDRGGGNPASRRVHLDAVERRAPLTGKYIVDDLVRQARFKALVSIGEKDAARDLVERELDELFG